MTDSRNNTSSPSSRRVLVTGCAGFIGMHVAQRLLEAGANVIGVDNFDPYYDVRLKEDRVRRLTAHSTFTLQRMDLAEPTEVAALFAAGAFDEVVHLAAQAGVRYSLVNPAAYVRNNLVAFNNILEGCRAIKVRHLVYASSSSVYGANHTLPFSEDQSVDHPVSLYAATKKSNELMAYSYSHLFGFPSTGLRFFTVYGPWGRPDMSAMIFTRAILAGKPIDVFNHGKMLRDFTYIDDIVEGVVRVLDRPPKQGDQPAAVSPTARPSAGVPRAPAAVYNIGNNQPVELETFIGTIENLLGRKAVKNYLPLQAGDVPATYASIDRLQALTGFAPHTPLAQGLAKLVDWYRMYYTAAA